MGHHSESPSKRTDQTQTVNSQNLSMAPVSLRPHDLRSPSPECPPPSSFTSLSPVPSSFQATKAPCSPISNQFLAPEVSIFQEVPPVKDVPVLSSACGVKATFLTSAFEGHSLVTRADWGFVFQGVPRGSVTHPEICPASRACPHIPLKSPASITIDLHLF